MLMMDYIKILIFIGIVIAAAIVHAILTHKRVCDIEGKFNFINLYTNTKIKNLVSRIEKLEEGIEKGSNMKSDNVNSPPHYRQGEIECIEAIKASMSEEGFRDYLKGNVMKYIWRYEHKGRVIEDIEKALWYLNRLKDELYGQD
nr:MAG TPA: nucelotide kinase [Caudoviricetes sp.]